MFAPFLFDVLWTLYRRSRRGAALSEAHREHLYQRLNQAGWSHTKVSGFYAVLVAGSAVGAFFASRIEPGLTAFVPVALAGAFATAMRWAKPIPGPAIPPPANGS